MAYYTGTVADYDQLFNILINRCVDHGWVWSNNILSKGDAFVKVTVSNVGQTVTADPGNGITIQGGTGQSGANLINPSAARGRLGRPDNNDKWKVIAWPAIYHLHLFEDTDEVFLVLNFDVVYHYWLAFGVSDVSGLPGTGLWFHGIATAPFRNISSTYGGITLTPTNGNITYNYGHLTGFLCTTNNTNSAGNPVAIHTGLDSIDWYGYAQTNQVGAFSAWETLAPLIAQSPSSWNQDSVLLPIHGYVGRSEYKRSCALMVRNARYIRVDNYEVGDTITLGSDVWNVYPFYCKNVSVRDGGNGIDHSGTFGWAIRR